MRAGATEISVLCLSAHDPQMFGPSDGESGGKASDPWRVAHLRAMLNSHLMVLDDGGVMREELLSRISNAPEVVQEIIIHLVNVRSIQVQADMALVGRMKVAAQSVGTMAPAEGGMFAVSLPAGLVDVAVVEEDLVSLMELANQRRGHVTSTKGLATSAEFCRLYFPRPVVQIDGWLEQELQERIIRPVVRCTQNMALYDRYLARRVLDRSPNANAESFVTTVRMIYSEWRNRRWANSERVWFRIATEPPEDRPTGTAQECREIKRDLVQRLRLDANDVQVAFSSKLPHARYLGTSYGCVLVFDKGFDLLQRSRHGKQMRCANCEVSLRWDDLPWQRGIDSLPKMDWL